MGFCYRIDPLYRVRKFGVSNSLKMVDGSGRPMKETTNPLAN